jgi:hypothetical protein
MNISPRFTEFGMTGAFFLISQLAVLVFLSPSADSTSFNHHWSAVLDAFQGSLPKVLQESSDSLVTVIGVICIFITGLILDLIGSYFAFLEIIIFSRHIQRNRVWFDVLAAQFPERIQNEYLDFRDRFGEGFVVTLPKLWERIWLSPAYKNLQSFLFSYVQVFSSVSQMLDDNMHLWRTSRAISTTLLILAVEVFLFTTSSDRIQLLYFLLFFGVSALITLRSYSRLCFTLFSLACVTHEKQSRH